MRPPTGILSMASILLRAVVDDAQEMAEEGAPCVVCPDGATSGDDYAPFVDFGDSITCSELIYAAGQFENGTESCELSAVVATTSCCPGSIIVDDPCVLCPDGVTSGDDFVAYEIAGINQTCGELIEEYKFFESDSDYCRQYGELDEALCCPTPAEDPCIICPNGTTVPDDFIPYIEIGNCAQLIDFLKTIESTSDVCTPEMDESLCCPPPPEDPCIICSNGATAPDDFIPYASAGVFMTCPELIEYSKTFESSDPFCTPEMDEAKCCPPPPEDPCIICPNGATAAEDFIPYTNIGNCEQLIDFLKLYESSDPFCTAEYDEAMCCPTVPEDPCIICPNGATVDDDFLPYAMLGSNQTCEELIDFAKNFETGSDICAESELDESFCCPTVAENPCAICPDGTSGAEYAFSSFGDFIMPCDVLMEHLAHFPIESDYCFEFSPVYAEACCPTETGDVPIFIPIEETTTTATAVGVSEETDTEVSGEVTTTSSTSVSSPGELAELDLEDLTVTTPPASSSSSFLVSSFAVFASIPIALVLLILALV
jgi:hypothetical protein